MVTVHGYASPAQAEHFSERNGFMNVVYVLSPERAPLMPCSCVIARLLLKQGKAKVVRRTPFTIQLLARPENAYTQPLTLGVDTGSSVMGSAVADENGNVLYLSEVEIRNDIAQALKNPEVLQNKWLYQKGINYGYANTKAYVLTRDGYTCQHCKGKSKDHRLEVHHLVFRSEHGSDGEANLLTLCKTCHDGLHAGTVTLKQRGKRKGNLLHATQMNSIRTQLLQRVQAEETWGFVTKEHRLLAGLPKEHIFDAAMIATRGTKPVFQTSSVLRKKCVPDGDYQQTKGVRSEQRIPTGKISGFRKFDKVRYLGHEYFIKGRMATGYAILMDISGNKLALKPIPKFEKMKRVSARSSWILHQRTIPSFSSSLT